MPYASAHTTEHGDRMGVHGWDMTLQRRLGSDSDKGTGSNSLFYS
jgi:hypothetical protein